MWNVPRVVRITDSLGNVFDNPTDSHNTSSIFEISASFHCGDTYSINIEMDSSFQSEEYDIVWEAGNINEKHFFNKEIFVITFNPKHVSQTYIISCTIISKKEWHKYFGVYDCRVQFFLTVLPPDY